MLTALEALLPARRRRVTCWFLRDALTFAGVSLAFESQLRLVASGLDNNYQSACHRARTPANVT